MTIRLPNPLTPLCLIAAALATAAAPAIAQDKEFGDRTPYYEDDALLDVTEWFDGNDYNPTDEAWWRWDDETYDRNEDVSGDRDAGTGYGYTTRDDNDWYYDYYDPTAYSWTTEPQNGLYASGTRYFDLDNDGTYDAMSTFYDRNADGTYENYQFYSFTDAQATANQPKSNQPKTSQPQALVKQDDARASRERSVTGTIDKVKTVKVRGGTEHLVAAVTPRDQQDQSAKPTMIDLGAADKFPKAAPKAGDTITAKGPRAQFGEHLVLLATSVEMEGNTVKVDRSPRVINAKVLDTHETTIRGRAHRMAMVETSQKGKTHKVAVDLGPANTLGTDIREGSQLAFTGFPVKVKDRPLFIAQSIQKDGRTIPINRGTSMKPGTTELGKSPGTTDSPSNKK